MARTNAATRNGLQLALRAATKEATRLTADITGATSEPVRQAANALRRQWRLLLNTRAGSIRQSIKTKRLRGTPSAPGQPPHKLSGRSQGSVRQAVVDGVRRVGTGWYVLRLMETGVNAQVQGRRTSPKGRRAGKRKIAARTRPFTLRIAPRPSATVAVQRAAPQMADVFVSEAQRRMARPR